MVDALTPLAELLRLNTRLLTNTLVEMDDAAAAVRPGESTNNVAFIAGHLVESRAWMGRMLGVDTPAPFGGTLEHEVEIDQVATLPTLADIRTAWTAVSAVIDARLATLGAADLAAPAIQRFPVVGQTILGSIAFLVQHESYHIGQLALLRKYLGLPSMSYR